MSTGAYPDSKYLMALAVEAGNIMLKNFTLGMKKQLKEDETPVTVSDTAINTMVLEQIGRDYPTIQIIGEEGSREVADAEYTVLCDPVDGTIPFSLGVPISAFCISVIRGNMPVVAVIYDPFQKRMWEAEAFKGARLWTHHQRGGCGGPFGPIPVNYQWESEPVHVSMQPTIHKSNICMIWWGGSDYNLHGVCEKLMEGGSKWVNPCSIAYFGGLVASGEFDATIFPGKKGWETAAMQLIVEEAGGKVTDIHGEPMVYGPKGEIQGHIISNGLIHDALVRMVRMCNP